MLAAQIVKQVFVVFVPALNSRFLMDLCYLENPSMVEDTEYVHHQLFNLIFHRAFHKQKGFQCSSYLGSCGQFFVSSIPGSLHSSTCNS